MGEVINCALRPLTVLAIIGAVVAFALLELSNVAGIAAAGPGASISVSSTTARADVQVHLTVTRLPIDMPAGSSVVLFLEDDYFVPDPIGLRTTWFTVSGVAEPGKTPVSQPGRHYPTDPIEVDEDNYYGGDDDYSIRVYLPDLSPGASENTQGFQGAVAGQTLRLIFHKSAGIKNPSMAGSHRLGYSILGPGAAVPRIPQHILPEPGILPEPRTFAKVGLTSDEAARGQLVIAIGSGFNSGVSASLYMKHYAADSAGNPTAGRWMASYAGDAAGARGTLANQGGDPNAAIADADAVAANRAKAWLHWQLDDFNLAVGDVMTPAETCIDIIANGAELGRNIVGKDHHVEIEFTVTNPPFRPGDGNLLCMVDDKGLRSDTDVEHFNLDPYIHVAPATVNAGDTVTVTAVDYPAGSIFRWLTVQGQRVAVISSSPIGDNGQGSATFTAPGGIAGNVRVFGCWGGASSDDCDQKAANITVRPSRLTLSKETVRPNESIVIRGSGFGNTPSNALASAQIGDVEMKVVSDGGNLADIEVSDNGQFAATFAIWPANPNDKNPTLRGGALEIKITDAAGFASTAQVTIVTPFLGVTPGVAGPRDYVIIHGSDWPVENRDGGDITDVNVEISGGGITTDTERAKADANGNWSIRYRVPGDVGIPSTLTVKATYGSSQDIVKLVNFSVPSADLTLMPSATAPGADIVLNAVGMAPFESNIEVTIGSRKVAVPTGATSNRAGEIRNLVVKVPALNAGAYTVQLKVGATVTITELTVLEHKMGSTEGDTLTLTPNPAVSGENLTLNASGFVRYNSNITVKIGDFDVSVPTGTSTDREGNLEVTIKVPSLYASIYTVQVQVGGDGGTVAISEVVILDAAAAAGGEDELTLSASGFSLYGSQRVFHFSNATKTWTFYDPRPEFAELNTLTTLSYDQSYWILVSRDQSVTPNDMAHEMACQGESCWIRIVFWRSVPHMAASNADLTDIF